MLRSGGKFFRMNCFPLLRNAQQTNRHQSTSEQSFGPQFGAATVGSKIRQGYGGAGADEWIVLVTHFRGGINIVGNMF